MHDEDREGYTDDPLDYLDEPCDKSAWRWVAGTLIVFFVLWVLVIRGCISYVQD